MPKREGGAGELHLLPKSCLISLLENLSHGENTDFSLSVVQIFKETPQSHLQTACSFVYGI